MSPSILVTGVPRSGTTWLARLLAQAPGTAMPGREPLNPHKGQYRLAGTLDAWARLEHPTAKQRRSIARAYRGFEPRVFGRYGRRVWAAPLRGTTVVIKDPFAVLSIPTIHEITGARTVLVYRHPAAVLASYRRMGWRPDVAEIARLHPDLGEAAPGPSADLVAQMGFFWQACHDMALADVDRAGLPADALVVVAHEEVAASGDAGVRRLFAACGLRWSNHVARHVQSWSRGEVASAETGGPLHVLDRSPQDVGSAWRANVSSVELSRLEEATSKARAALDLRRLRLSDA